MNPFGSLGRARGRRVFGLTVVVSLLAAALPLLGSGVGPARALPPSATPTPAGYWLVAADGGVFPAGGAPFFGSTGAIRLNRPIVGMAATPSGAGYWLVASDGGIFSFGDAGFFGSTGAIRLNRPIVGMAATPSGAGYWLVASDGGIFSFGDAGFFGSTGAIRLNRPIVGMAATPSGAGYWLVASDGGIFSFGDAGFFGSTGAIRLNRPIVGMAATPTGTGYWLMASDGGLFAYGDARFFGSAAASGTDRPGDGFVALVPTSDNAGYWQAHATGLVLPFGTASRFADLPQLGSPIVGALPFRRTGSAPVGVGPPGSTPGTDVVSPAVTKGRPNILFILLDDLRDEGIMDVAEVLPKTKQWLQAGGTTFTQAYTTTPLCCPERATIWSGRYGHNHGVFDNHLGGTLDRDWIIPRYLHDAGYTTGLVGKFITDWHYRYEPPHFDSYAAFQGDYTDQPFWVKNPGEATYHTEIAAYSTDFIADKATGFVDAFEADDDRPWFMQVSPHAPHDIKPEGTATSGCNLNDLYTWPDRHDNVAVAPWTPTPAVDVEGSPTEKADKVPYLRSQRYSRDCSAVIHEGQLRTLLAADDMVDTVMQKLQATGELDNTMVIFTTDNGYSWGERGVTSKGLPYTEHVKAPFLVRWDGVFPAGATDDRLVGGEDFLPTYLQAAQYSPPEVRYPLDGRSFLPGQPGKAVKLLEFGPLDRPSPPRYEGHHGIPTWASLRTAGWQYIEYYGADNTTVEWQEYYDLTQDPWELDNLVVTDPARVPGLADLSAELRRIRTCVGTTGTAACP